MEMRNIYVGMAAVVCAAGSLLYVPEVSAGDVSNASLACYVDTRAYDQLTSDYCASGWRPGDPNPTTAHFEVIGLTPGSYSFTWNSSCGTGAWCNKSITKDTSKGVPVTLSVLIRDNATGRTKTVSATAEYIDMWR
ncbi:hypothetical protein [Pseudoxanthomonas dokdonensis]|uniref:hypothetical protein n=1 Tax=Pseudoxanthomonas dokdonensis TaxID=344882 RepID=UPI0012ED4C57|nr:hypothetical protein [Pseudoxanthomonas dokdonensis]